MLLLPNHTPSVRTKGLSAPSLRPPRNPYKSVLHMPGRAMPSVFTTKIHIQLTIQKCTAKPQH